MTEPLPPPWIGASGTKYHGATFPIDADLPPLSGVYVAFRRDPLGLQGLYVGQTRDFRQRLVVGRSTHDGLRRAGASGATLLTLIAVEGEDKRRAVEKDLIDGLRPPCNAQPVNALAALYWSADKALARHGLATPMRNALADLMRP